MKTRKFVLFTSVLLSMFSAPNIILAQTTDIQINNSINDTISPRSDVIEWRFKTVNGILYKRQYNISRNKWIGKWQRA